MTSFTCIHTNGVYQQYKGNICNRAFKCGSELPEYVALILRNGGSQSPDRWLRELRNNHEAYSLPKGEVVELTEKQIKDTLKGFTTDRVYGLRLSEAGELELDTDDFFTTNMMKKIHTNTLVPMVEDACLANLFYIVIGTHKEKGNTMYDVISSRYERTSFTEEKVKTLLDMHIISAGAKMQDGKVVVAPLEKPKAPEPTNE